MRGALLANHEFDRFEDHAGKPQRRRNLGRHGKACHAWDVGHRDELAVGDMNGRFREALAPQNFHGVQHLPDCTIARAVNLGGEPGLGGANQPVSQIVVRHGGVPMVVRTMFLIRQVRLEKTGRAGRRNAVQKNLDEVGAVVHGAKCFATPDKSIAHGGRHRRSCRWPSCTRQPMP